MRMGLRDTLLDFLWISFVCFDGFNWFNWYIAFFILGSKKELSPFYINAFKSV